MDVAAVEIRNLSYSYPDNTEALEDVSLNITVGERVVILGANGAGKSTLLLHLNGLLRGSGLVRICGLEVKRRNLNEIRRKAGVVFQNPDDQLFCPTVYEDIAFGLRNLGFSEEAVKGKVRDSLEQTGVPGFEHRSAHHLSFGQKRRVAIATVLAMEPEILVLDEPTSNLDPKGKRQIRSLLGEISLTQIIVTHDLNSVREMADRVVVMFGGRIFADGKPGEILGDEELLKAADLW